MRKHAYAVIMAITIASLLSCDLQRRADAPDMKGKAHDEQELGRDVPSVKDEASRLVVQNGHSSAVYVIKWSPDGNMLASGSSDNSVRLWDKRGNLLKTLGGHTNAVVTLAFSPDGNMLASGSYDKTVRLWDKQGNLLKILEGNTGGVETLAFSPDGNTLASGSSYHTFRLWDREGNLLKILDGNIPTFSPDGNILASGFGEKTVRLWYYLVRLWDKQGNLINILKGHTGHINTLAFSPDGNMIASGANDNTVRLWDKQGNLIKTLEGHTAWVNILAYSPDGNMIASGANDNTVRLWDKQGNLIKTLEGHTAWVNTLAFSPDGNSLASGSHDDHTIRLWDKQGNLIKILQGHTGNVNTLAFSPDGNSLASAGGDSLSDNSLRLWDKHGNLFKILEGHTFSVRTLAYSPDGNTLVSGDRIIRMWDKQGTLIKSLEGHNSYVMTLTFNPDGNMLASGSLDKTARLWDKHGNPIKALDGHTSYVSSLAFSPDGSILASGSGDMDNFDNNILLWDRKGTLKKKLPGHSTALAFSPDGKTIASGSMGSTVPLWDKEGNHIKTLTGHRGPIYILAFSPDGSMLASGSWDHTIRLWDKQGNLIKSLDGHTDHINTLAFSPDGSTLASGSDDNTVRLWDKQGNLLKILGGHTNRVTSLAFSPDGNTLCSGSWDHTARLWDKQGNLIKTLEGHTQEIITLAFSPDGNTLASGSNDGSIKIWNSKSGKLLATLLSFNTGDWFTITDDGYWDGSRNGGQYVAMVKGMEAFGVDQFAIWNNRPDIILERLGSTDTEAIASYKKQYDKRIRKLQKIYNVGESALSGEYHVPLAKVRDAGERNPQDKFITITADLSDDKYKLVAYNVYINDVPLYRGFGPKIEGKKKTITEKIELIEGDNKIEVSCLNEKGAESYRGRVFASYLPAKDQQVKPKLYYIGFGVSRYALPGKIKTSEFKKYVRRSAVLKKSEREEIEQFYPEQGEYFVLKSDVTKEQAERLRALLDRADLSLDLKYAHQDVLDLAETFKKMEGKEYSEVIVKPYINEQVTSEAIKNGKDILKNATVDDTFVLFISGHGVHDKDKEATYYYLTSNADLENLAGTAAPFETVEDLMQDIKPRKKLFFMDTCESGELDDAKMNSFIVATKDSKGVRARSIRKRSVDQGETSPAPKRAFLLEKERYIYNDLFRRSGAIVFSSCQGNEVSYEHDALKNGFFTAAIKRAIREGKADGNKDNLISTDELRDFVAKEVPAICRELKIREHAIQHPTVDRDNLFMKLKFPAVR